MRKLISRSLRHQIALAVLSILAVAGAPVAVYGFNVTSLLVTSFDWDATPSSVHHAVTDQFGTDLPAGSGVVGIGFFSTLTTADIGALSGNLTPSTISLLADDFVRFGTVGAGPGVTVGAGRVGPFFDIAGTYDFLAEDVLESGSLFVSERIYTFIGNGLDYASSTAIFIYDHDRPFPLAVGGLTPTIPVSISSDVNTGKGELLVGNFGIFESDFGGLDPAGPAAAFSLEAITDGAAIIPEPSRALLSLLGLGAVLVRRRRIKAQPCFTICS